MRAVELGMLIVDCSIVRIWVARIVIWMTLPETSIPLPSKVTKSPTPYCFSVRMKNPARKSAMMFCVGNRGDQVGRTGT